MLDYFSVSATPEFIHPRKPDVPQWLMSPPVGDQDPNIISYAPVLYHNMRIPSVTGIAIPIVRPNNPSVAVSNDGLTGEISKVGQENQVASPVTYYSMEPISVKSEMVVPENTPTFDSQGKVQVHNPVSEVVSRLCIGGGQSVCSDITCRGRFCVSLALYVPFGFS